MDLADARIPKNVRNGQILSHGDDSTILATFSDEYVVNEYRTEAEGKTIYDHKFQIVLEFPGNNTFNSIHRFSPEEVATSQWPQRFPRQWQAFKDQREQVNEGTPIELWPPIDKRRVLELKASKVYTVEQIAALTDMSGPNIGLEWRKLRDMAKAYLEPSQAVIDIARISKENETLKNQLDTMQRQMSSLANASGTNVDNLMPVTLEEKPKRGRRPKQVEQTAA